MTGARTKMGIRSLLSSLVAIFAGHAPASAAPQGIPDYVDTFSLAFTDGYKLKIDDAFDGKPPNVISLSFRVLELGKLKVVSGKIGACDPFVSIDARAPFTQAVPNGEHPVRLAIAEGGMDDGRVAFARIDFSSSPVVTWKMATVDGQDFATLKAGEIFGYPVDAGTGSFYDPRAAQVLTAALKVNPDAWEDWQAQGEANGKAAHLKPNFFLMMPAGDVNIAMFVSGWGDGFYASYFGFDTKGDVVALVTDFSVVNWSKVQR